METIFRGMLQSRHPPPFKRAFLEKTVLSAAKNADAVGFVDDSGGSNGVVPVCHRMFDATLDYLGRLEPRIDDPDHADNEVLCCLVFDTWSRHHTDHLHSFLDPATARRFLSAPDYAPNRCAVFRLLAHAVQLLSTLDRDLSPLVESIRAEAPGLLLEDDNLNLATELITFWSQFDRDLHRDDVMLTEVTKSLLQALARCNAATMTSIDGAVAVADFIGYVWAHSDETVIREGLTEIYKILASNVAAIPGRSADVAAASSSAVVSHHFKEPCHCLASVAQYIPLALLEVVCRSMVLTNGVTAAMTLQLVLCRLVDWLQWPDAKNVDKIIMQIMKLLENNKSYAILFLVTQLKSEQIFLLLKCEPMRSACATVVIYMLLAYQHSPDVFHKVIVKVPEVLLFLREENTVSSLVIAERVTAMVYALMQLHSGFPEIYDPVLPVLQNVSPEWVKMIQEFMATKKWGSFGLNYSSHSLTLQPKSTTGKVGLVNLGNTCYMNSVLQAVYMNDEFRFRVLTALVAARQPLLFQLQRVFTFLTHSERPSYSPKGFLQASKPPWFDVGRQQDCSEFLRNFFDSMHEQECLGSAHLRCVPYEISSPSATAGCSGEPSSSGKAPRLDYVEPSTAMDSEADSSVSQCLIHELFSGQLSTSYRCLQCQHVSVQRESFIDLSLALPECNSQSKYIQKKELKAGRAEPADSEVHLGECSTSGNGGQAQLLEVEDDVEVPAEPSAVGADDEDLNLEDLIRYYISPEKLEGENRYFCTSCDQLQEAQKTIRITAAPKYLTCTILRFAYDVQTQRRVKILRNVVYPEVLSIPVASSAALTTGTSASLDDKDPADQDPMTPMTSSSAATDMGRPHLYALYAVVVHSGASSDCGHYYTYACSSEALPDAFRDDEDASMAEVVADNNPATAAAATAAAPDRRVWYLFNDSRVTYSEYQSVANLSQRFARDTAYLLFYRRVGGPCDARRFPGDVDPKQVKLRRDLEEVVQRDNLLYAQELEEAMLAAQKKGAASGSWHDFDDQNPPGNCGGGGGLGSFTARFVC